LKCRLYSSAWSRPRQVTMPTRCADSSQMVTASRFPNAESLFQEPCLQPYIHNCEVTIVEGRHTYRFHVFFKRHCRLRPNPLLSRDDNEFRGDAVVMRVGTRSVVNMRPRDAALADYMM
ncbi:hypothetical protein F5141DRAFT_964374, partial [Pisolithus sp. B1]